MKNHHLNSFPYNGHLLLLALLILSQNFLSIMGGETGTSDLPKATENRQLEDHQNGNESAADEELNSEGKASTASHNKAKPVPSLQEIEKELFGEIQRLRWKIGANSKMLDSLKSGREEGAVNESGIVIQMEREKALFEGLKRDEELLLSLEKEHAKLLKRTKAASSQEKIVQKLKKTVVDADIIEGPQFEEEKRVRGSAALLFDSITTSAPIEGKTSTDLLEKTVKEISTEQ
ncbi:hypothetical protein MLD52_15525 [Puniceicoccaceae bacterium K14]|nr:hypothetical protein [Puniceicoccaceae bacterium K14]